MKADNKNYKDPLDKPVLGHFIQLNTSPKVYHALCALIDESPYATAVFFYCAMRCSKYNHINMYLPDVCEIIGCKIRNLYYSLEILEKYGFIKKIGGHGSHSFDVNALITWKNAVIAREICMAKGNVFAGPIIIPGSDTPCENLKFENFTQISSTQVVLKTISDIAINSPSGLKIALYMAMNCNDKNEIEIKRSDIARTVGCSEKSVSVAIKLLSKYNILEAKRRDKVVTYYLNTEFTFKNKARNIEKFEYMGALQKQYKDIDDGIDGILENKKRE